VGGRFLLDLGGGAVRDLVADPETRATAAAAR